MVFLIKNYIFFGFFYPKYINTFGWRNLDINNLFFFKYYYYYFKNRNFF